jgi:hypothetical protein
VTAKKAIAGLPECMESLGGVEYLGTENMQFNIARLYRDANVLSIWEETTDMMAHDGLRVMYGKTSREVVAAVNTWVWSLLQSDGPLREQELIVGEWRNNWKTTMEKSERRRWR